MSSRYLIPMPNSVRFLVGLAMAACFISVLLDEARRTAKGREWGPVTPRPIAAGRNDEWYFLGRNRNFRWQEYGHAGRARRNTVSVAY